MLSLDFSKLRRGSLALLKPVFASTICIIISHIMLYVQHLTLFALPAFLFSSATKVLPRAQHAADEPGAVVEIRNVMLGAGVRPNPQNAPIPRRWGARAPISGGSSESPGAAIKKMLLHRRAFTCDPGYALCSGGFFDLQPTESRLTVDGRHCFLLPRPRW